MDNKTQHVLHINYVMAYQCIHQDKIQSNLWSCSSVNLFTYALTTDRKTTMVICTDYKGKDKIATGMFLNLLHKKYIPCNDAAQEEIIWSDLHNMLFQDSVEPVNNIFTQSVFLKCNP